MRAFRPTESCWAGDWRGSRSRELKPASKYASIPIDYQISDFAIYRDRAEIHRICSEER